MSISVRQIDSAAGGYGGAGDSSSFVQTFFESNRGFTEILAGDALLLIFGTDKADTQVTSITDNYGNTWTHVPNSRVSIVGSDMERSLDVWRADNVSYVPPYNPSLDTLLLQISIHFTGTALHAASALMLDVVGINGGSATAVTSSHDAVFVPSITGPSVDGGSDALYFTGGSWAAFDGQDTNVDSPFTFGSGPTGPLNQENYTPFAAAYYLGSGPQSTKFNHGSYNPTSSYAITAVAFGPAASGGGGGTPLSLDTTSLRDATIGMRYSASLAVSGGTGPYTFAVYSGSLPSGLSLDASTGVISGMPAYGAGGNFTVTIQVTDSLGAMASRTFSLDSVALIGGSWDAYEEIRNPKPAAKTTPAWLPIKGF